MAGCQVVPPSVDTSTSPTWPPTLLAVPVTVTHSITAEVVVPKGVIPA